MVLLPTQLIAQDTYGNYEREVKTIEYSIEEKIRLTFPENAELMLAVAKAESNLNPNAYNPRDSHRGCTGSIGIFQIGCLHVKNGDDLFDVDTNLQYARHIYDTQGITAWGAFTDKNYLKHLN